MAGKTPLVSASKCKRVCEADFSDSDSEEDILCGSKQSKSRRKKTSREEREDQVHSIMDELKMKHGASFTPMQYRIWSEMMAGGIHASLDDPPTSPMFVKAGKGENSSKKKNDGTSVAEALTQAAVAISSSLSPRAPDHSQARASPSKVIEPRSKCYKQLSDLNNLKECGILRIEEYTMEINVIWDVLTRCGR